MTTSHTYTIALSLLKKYQLAQASELDSQSKLLIEEASSKIRDLQRLSQRIRELNLQLIGELEPRAIDALQTLEEARDRDPELDHFFESNPNLQVDNVMKAIPPVAEGLSMEDLERRERDLKLDTVNFYYTAHRVLKMLKRLALLEGISCREIMIVRNQLLEHPEKHGSTVIYDSFGYGKLTGPVIKALRLAGQSEIHPDPGFYQNEKSLLGAIVSGLQEALSFQ